VASTPFRATPKRVTRNRRPAVGADQKTHQLPRVRGGSRSSFRTRHGMGVSNLPASHACAALWFPVTFGTSTVLHAFLLSHATTLPPWMQLFHIPVAMMAKSKILVLPVYPAAWPQAKRHPIVMGILRLYCELKRFTVLQRLAIRYRQIEFGSQRLTTIIVQAPVSVGLNHVFKALSRALQSRITTPIWLCG
jgi:hypothetical protein